jgi:hypothetical protein
MEYLTLALLFIAAVGGITATTLTIIVHFKKDAHWAQSAAWLHGDICRYALWASIATAVLELYV